MYIYIHTYIYIYVCVCVCVCVCERAATKILIIEENVKSVKFDTGKNDYTYIFFHLLI